jgi:monothiol glutaredoxin
MTRFNPHPFRVVEDVAVAQDNHGREFAGDDRALPPLERVDRMVRSAELFVFIKGSPDEPRCGFSAHTVGLLNAAGVPFVTFDVLGDPTIRAAAKEYAGWPTFPQLYVRGEFVGGNDVITELQERGELAGLLAGVGV